MGNIEYLDKILYANIIEFLNTKYCTEMVLDTKIKSAASMQVTCVRCRMLKYKCGKVQWWIYGIDSVGVTDVMWKSVLKYGYILYKVLYMYKR